MKRKINFLMTLLLFGVCLVSAQQNLSVSGVVSDAGDGSPLVGVSVSVKGTTSGTITDMNGKYSLNATQGSKLVFSYIGMEKQEITVKDNLINAKMESDSKMLDEVVAIGYGTMRKKVITGATVQVKGDDLQKLNTLSSMAALQGTTSGVQITKSDGQPGDGLKVVIRGIGTIGQTQPLYVVDGVPVGNNIDYLSPSDIESVDVLKDATAAIYGSRAANGVVLVTTKQGKGEGKPTVSYDGYYGVQNIYKKAPSLNAQEYLMIANEARVNSGLSPFTNQYLTGMTANATNPAIPVGTLVPNVPDAAGILAGTNPGTNWLDAITNKNAPTQSHSINISGGNAMTTYNLGLSYVSQDGIFGKVVPSNYDRYNVRMNSDHKIITNKNFTVLRVGENLDYSFNEKTGISGSGSVYWNDVNNMIVAIPLQPLYDASGKYSYSIPFNNLQANPVAGLVNSSRGNNISKNHNLIGNVYAELQPIKNLIFVTRFSLNVGASSSRSFTPAYNLSSTAINTNDGAAQYMNLGMSWTWENTVSYKFSTNEHNFSFLAGTSAERSGLGESMGGTNSLGLYSDFAHAYLTNYPNVTSTTTTLQGSPYGIGGLNSYFGRINYDYKGTYMLSAILRTDGSSNFNNGHRWGTFPSFSGGWVVTNESFMKDVKEVNFLKIRASWGQNGNNAISPFQYLAQIGTGPNTTLGVYPNYFFGANNKSTSSVGSFPSQLPNLDVKWETSEQTDLGLDATFLNNRLNFTFDYYNKATKDWLVQAPIPAVWGTGAPYINGGNIVNKGYEFSLGWRDHVGDFKYNITGNIAFNHNEVTKIANASGFINGQSNVFGSTDVWYRAQEGYPIGYFYGYKTAGIFQTIADVKAYVDPKTGLEIMPNAKPGDVKFVDLNGNGSIDANDRTKIGNPNPAYSYGLTASFEYKGFDLNIVGTGVGGNQIAQCTDFEDPILSNNTTDILARWHGTGTSNFLPRVTASPTINTQYLSDIYMRNGDYFKISNITLGYDFKKLFHAMPLTQARLYVQVQNLYTFTKYSGMDPEVSYAPDSWASGVDIGQYPSARTVLVGVNVKF